MRSFKGLWVAAIATAVWAFHAGEASAAPTVDMLTDVACTNGAGGVVEVPPILITEDGTNFTIANDIRLIIPSTYGMTWDTGDTSLEVLRSGSGILSTTVGAFTTANQVCRLDVTNPSAAGDRFVISGLGVTGWNSEETADTLGMSYDGSVTAQVFSAQFFATGGASISSANNFCFNTSQTKPTLPDVTVTDSSAAAVITAANNIRLCIRDNGGVYGTAPTWDITMTSVTITGSASGKVSNALAGASFQNGNRTLILDVTSNFATSETITISGLKFATSATTYTADSLELVVDGTNAPGKANVVAVDDKVYAIGPANVAMAAVATISGSAVSTSLGNITVTDTNSDITAASDIRLLIMSTSTNSTQAAAGTAGTAGRNNLSWDNGVTPSMTQPTVGAVTAGAITATDTGNNSTANSASGFRLAFFNVTTDFAAADVFAVSGMKITNASATATSLNIGLVIAGYTNASATAAYGRVVSIVTPQSLGGGGGGGGGSGGGAALGGGGGGGSCFLRAAGRPSCD